MATDTTGRQHCSHHFLPDHYVITPIRRAIHNRQDVLFELDGANTVLVRGDQGQYSAERGFDPVKFCTAPVGQIRVTVLDPSEADRRTERQRVQNADELLWTAGFVASGGRLMEGCNAYDIVEIERWPNLTRLPHTPNTMRIIAMLARHVTSIAVARKALKIEPSEINQVYSAARCAGIARVINVAVQEPILKPHRNQTLLSQLMAKIAGL
jgi:hypothetical protein